MSAAEIFFHRNLRNLNRKKKNARRSRRKNQSFFCWLSFFSETGQKEKKNSANGSYCVRPVKRACTTWRISFIFSDIYSILCVCRYAYVYISCSNVLFSRDLWGPLFHVNISAYYSTTTSAKYLRNSSRPCGNCKRHLNAFSRSLYLLDNGDVPQIPCGNILKLTVFNLYW